MESSVIEALCSRCQSFGLDRYVEKGPPEESRSIIATVTPDSAAKDRCALCVVITDLLEEDGPGSGPLEHDNQFPSAAVRLHVYAEPDWGPNMVYLNIFSTGPRASLRLFLLQKAWPNSGGTTYDSSQDVGADSPNLDHVKQWLDNCRDSHALVSSRCTPLRTRPSAPLRVIDCRARTVRLAESDEPYICLSYVWGKCGTSSTFDGVALPSDLPQTIEDAMFVANELDIPQLWVDQYCMNQKDPVEKMKTIQEMDLVYGGAELTIVAASGEDASSGLPGIRGKPRQIRRLVKSGNHPFWMSRDISMSFRRSRWNTRGWTYQEGLLSRRRLVFTDARLYCQCDGDYYVEAFTSGLEDMSEYMGDSIRLFPPGTISTTSRFLYDRLGNYFPRNLSYGSDSLNAFQGVLNAFLCDDQGGDSPIKHFHGIPFQYSRISPQLSTRSILCGLAWRIDHAVTRQRAQSKEESSADFPSWTWASYKASHPNAMDRLMLDYVPGRLHYQEGVDVYISDRDAERVDIQEFALRSGPKGDTTNYSPCIYITSWSIKSRISVGSGGLLTFLVLQGKKELVHLDEVAMPRDGKEVVAVYLGGSSLGGKHMAKARRLLEHLVFMLVREAGRETYSRIGLLCVDLNNTLSQERLGVEETLRKIMEGSQKGEEMKWERRTLRLI